MQQLARFALAVLEIVILSALILATRCANYRDVFVGGNVYFTDADCYARMTRVQMCAEHPGLVVRHHDFENFPQGTTPHTTAPLDYAILAMSILLHPFTAHATDLAGALISPLFALIGGWFLWWWSRRMKFRYRWVMLALYAISPILVHGTEIGRPDHQSLLVLLVTIAICAEWSLGNETSTNWSVLGGMVWGLAIWVSAYEPLVLLVLVLATGAVQDRHRVFGPHRRVGWIVFGVIAGAASIIERRIPSLSILASDGIFRNWSRMIGELAHVSPLNRIWLNWAGYMLGVAPILIWYCIRKRTPPPPFILILLVATYLLTIWQARWSYFFMSIFAIVLPSLLAPIKSGAAVWFAFALSILPILREWDERIWPNEAELARQVERRNESIQLRQLALTIRSTEKHPFLAAWWLSPAIAYWSHQPGVAGSSHGSLGGIVDSARFFLTQDLQGAREILKNRGVEWVFAYDSDRVQENSASLLGAAIPEHPLCRTIDRTPTHAPRYLIFSGQNGTAKLFRFAEKP